MSWSRHWPHLTPKYPMQLTQRKWSRNEGWVSEMPEGQRDPAQLVLVFAATAVLRDGVALAELRHAHPEAQLVGCSTAGEIAGTQVSDDTLVATEIRFRQSQVQAVCQKFEQGEDSRGLGQRVAKLLPTSLPGVNDGAPLPLVHAFVISDGLHVNGSDLVRGLTEVLPPEVTLSGGLAGDGKRFGETLVLCGSKLGSKGVVLVGFYGAHLHVGCASLGGWDPFGPERLITRSAGNVLYELDGHSVLGLYRLYLGEHASELPASGLLFPLSLRTKEEDTPVVRTLLSMDEKTQGMTFAGDMPQGSYARMMKANYDRLIDGAVGAAERSYRYLNQPKGSLAILISCVGRKLILRQRVEEEVEGVRQVLGEEATLAGFYSYGEISPFTPGARCELHNQTMTITVIAED